MYGHHGRTVPLMEETNGRCLRYCYELLTLEPSLSIWSFCADPSPILLSIEFTVRNYRLIAVMKSIARPHWEKPWHLFVSLSAKLPLISLHVQSVIYIFMAKLVPWSDQKWPVHARLDTMIRKILNVNKQTWRILPVTHHPPSNAPTSPSLGLSVIH